MIVEWTESARRTFSKIKSDYFTAEETIAYKIGLLQRVESKIIYVGSSMPSKRYPNTYYCIIDKYIVSYKILNNGEKYVITSFKHSALKNR